MTTLSTQNLARNATLLMALATVVGGLLGGRDVAAGIALTGALSIANLWVWRVLVRRVIAVAVQGQRAGAWSALIYPAKLLVLCTTLFVLLTLFPPVSVLIGASVVVGAVMLYAVLGLTSPLRVGEG